MIVHRYLLTTLLRNLLLSSLCLVSLFLIVDFFDRIDNVLGSGAGFFLILQYFLLKLPQLFTLTLPVSFVIATLFTYGLLSKNSELTAMRSSGLKLTYLARPLIIIGLLFSVFNLILSETIVPYTARTVKEIYNIDIKKRNEKGEYSQENIWWRDQSNFYSSRIFDSRESTLHDFNQFQLNKNFEVREHLKAKRVKAVDEYWGWNIDNVQKYKLQPKGDEINYTKFQSLTFPNEMRPQEFYRTKLDPLSMSYVELKNYIEKQESYGQVDSSFYADLYAKLSFPFVVFICALTVFPLAIKPARTGNMASSFIYGILICFVYYALHSFSLALGRGELLPPLLSAWVANILFLFIASVLFWGSEAPE